MSSLHSSPDSWIEITDLTDRILTELDNPTLVLTGKLNGKQYSLEMSSTYKIIGSVIVKDEQEMKDDIIFQTVWPLSVPNEGCSVTPDEGFVLKTNFTVNCSGWFAEHVNLTYTFRYVHSTCNASILGQDLKKQDFSVVYFSVRLICRHHMVVKRTPKSVPA